jgi:hypothetical protein
MNSTKLNWPTQIPRLLWIQKKCPLCTSIEFRQAESAWPDGLLRMLALRAVRCANCWRRYYWFARRDAKG